MELYLQVLQRLIEQCLNRTHINVVCFKDDMKIVLKRGLYTLAILLIVLVVAGVVYEQISRLVVEKRLPKEFSTCVINDNVIHYVKKGLGGPTVVFESGLGHDSKTWSVIQDTISKYTTTFSYDRPGLYLSADCGRDSLDIHAISDDLQKLLEKSNCPKPYILVAHSIGCALSMPFIQQNNKDIASVIFIDGSHPKQLDRASEELQKAQQFPPAIVFKALVELGVFRIIHSNQPLIDTFSKDHFINRHYRDYFHKAYRRIIKESEQMPKLLRQSQEIESFGNLPLTVISASYPDGVSFFKSEQLEHEFLLLHTELQKQLLNLSTSSKQIVTNLGHFIYLEKPKTVIEIIKEDLKSGRK